jgi:hypothetical protein
MKAAHLGAVEVVSSPLSPLPLPARTCTDSRSGSQGKKASVVQNCAKTGVNRLSLRP